MSERPRRVSLGTALIVEDEPDILEVMQYNLTKEGFRVVSARDGEEGIGLAECLGKRRS